MAGHSGGVTGVVINGHVLASASYDGSVRLWSLKNYSCMHIFNGKLYYFEKQGNAIITIVIMQVPNFTFRANKSCQMLILCGSHFGLWGLQRSHSHLGAADNDVTLQS